MKILKWLMSRSGKIALSMAQTVGLSAVIGVAGVAAWQYLDSPSEDTAFNLRPSYNSGEVVYVAGAAGGSYGANGEVQSGFLATPSKAIEMTEKLALAQKRQEEYGESVSISDSSADPSTPQAYQMGGSEGLGMGANRANEEDLKNNPLALTKQSLAGVSDAIAQAQAQAQQQGENGAAKQGDAPATLASVSHDWGSSAATRGIGGGGTSSGGNAFNSSFVVQDSGKGTPKDASEALNNAEQVMKTFQAQASSIQEGARIRSKADFGGGVGSGRDGTVGDGRNSKEGRDLEFIRKRSADAAKNKNRAANEGSRAFLASTKVSGGISVSGENVTTGQGQGSADFESPTASALGGVQSWTAGEEGKAEERDDSMKKIRLWLWIALPLALAAMPWIAAMSTVAAALCSNPLTLPKGILMWIKAAALCLAALSPVMALLGVSVNHINHHGGATLSTWGVTVAGILAAGLGLCMIPAVGRGINVLSWKTIWTIVAPVGIGLAGAGALTGAVKGDEAVDTTVLDNTNNQ